MRILRPLITKLAYLLLGVVLAVGVDGTGAAQAETKMTRYPGSMCQVSNPASGREVSIWEDFVFNYSQTRSAIVHCPIPKTLSGGKLTNVHVDVLDEARWVSIPCAAKVTGSKDYARSSFKVSSDSDALGRGVGVYLGGFDYNGQTGDVYSLSCTLPKWTPSDGGFFTIYSYGVWETK